jgi:hypothetical protein
LLSFVAVVDDDDDDDDDDLDLLQQQMLNLNSVGKSFPQQLVGVDITKEVFSCWYVQKDSKSDYYLECELQYSPRKQIQESHKRDKKVAPR